MKKKIFIGILSFLLIFSATLSLSSCSGNAPNIDDVNERFVYLIEESKELNVIFFGTGLPIYRRDGELSNRKLVYSNDNVSGYNKVLLENSEYLSIDDIKAAADKIFSDEYLSELYESAFDGIMVNDTNAYVRFYDNTEWLYQSVSAGEFSLSERIYDYSTMEIVKPSNSKYVTVSIESYTLKDPKRRTVDLTFVYENGDWFLDSPTY
ncbi:MAG: hypothetical protein E7592_03005 [Ruminococcaceae bacterium]|nr:hypothetical protein [Oscillospiraceae bacterium]